MGAWADLYRFLGDFMFGFRAPPSNTGNTGGKPLPKHYAAAPLVGYRKWLVVNTPLGLALKSLHIGHTWQSRDITAECLSYASEVNTSHKAPDKNHACGVYSMLPDQDPLVEWENSVRGKASASGSIQMWGRIIECQRGYKAQYARIEDPIVLEASCQTNCDTPPVWAELTDQTVWTTCPGHSTESTDRTRVELSVWLREAQRQLSEKYGVETLSWIP